ncbi:MAG: cell division ATP-binding protein FtsE [Gammaproteobacteria bacterium]
MIKFENVSKKYPSGHEALKNVNLAIPRGELVFLTGHSGAGKSTLLKLILLLERCSRGKVLINDKCLKSIPNRNIPFYRRKIGMIFQDHRLLVERTVFDNIALPLIIGGYSATDIGKRVRAALDKVGLLGRESAYPMTLSTGERQRVGIARAIVHKPEIILADEPTGNLDPVLAHEIIELFQEFNKVGVTILVATHNLALIARFRNRILTLDNGELIAD